jgi:hypothetical protein
MYITWSDPFGVIVKSFEQSLNCSLQPLFMIVVTQIMERELILYLAVVLASSDGWYAKPEGP